MKHLSPDSLFAKFGGVYEHSAWITETLYDQKGRSGAEKPSELAGAMVKILAPAPQDLREPTPREILHDCLQPLQNTRRCAEADGVLPANDPGRDSGHG